MQAPNTPPLGLRLRPRARLLRTLGEELISNEVTAVIEMVKNAYDADATRVLIRFIGPLELGKGRVEVIDNGHGMELKTVQTVWMEPATPSKRDKLLISAVPVIKPVPANNSVITPTAAVPVTQAPQAATVIFLAQTVSPPPQKRLTIDVTNDNERRIREQKQKQELAQVQTERDRQVLIGKPTQDPLQSMFGPLFAYSGESYQ